MIWKCSDFFCAVQGEPFTVLVPQRHGATPNRKSSYGGFIPDLIEALSKRLRFDYELYTATEYGRFDNVTNQWTGMIAEVVRRDV